MAIEQAEKRVQTKPSSYITLRLGDELFAISVAYVREVLDMSLVTKLPLCPPHLRGVVNVRGTAIPVVDLRAKFGLPKVPDTVNSRIIVVELKVDGETAILGGLADGVHEVIEFEPGQIAPPPTTGLRWRAELIQGIARRDDRFIIIFDADKLFGHEELALAATAPDPSESLPQEGG